MRSVTRFATLLFATAALAACEDKVPFSNVVTPIEPITSIAGTWNLQTLNGLTLPQPIGGGINLTASTLTLVAIDAATGTFTLSIVTDDGTGAVTSTATGNYTLAGTVLSLAITNPVGAPTITGSFGGGNTLSLTLAQNGTNFTAVYARQ